MPRVSLVGNGHGGGEDYATLALWWAAESSIDYGSLIEAQCLGDCGNSVTLSGSTPHGSSIYTLSVTHDGTNSSSLAEARQVVVSTTSAILIDDMYLATNNQFVDAFNIQTGTLTSNRCVFNNRTAGNRAIFTGNNPTSTINNFVTMGGIDTVATGFSGALTLNKGLIFGATDKGVEAASSPNFIFTDVFSFNNVNDDFDSAQITTNTCASEDLTGDITGFTSAELVNFAGNDYRTKSTSTLATAGGGGSFIGAFLEASSGISIAVTLGTIDYTSQSAVVALTGSVDITTTLGTISYSSQNATVSLAGDIDVTATLGTIDYSSNNTTVSITSETIVNTTLGTIDYTSQNTTVVLSGLIDVTTTLGAIVYNSYPVTVQIGEGQAIGNVTAGFADDIYTAGFKPDTITVSFK